MRSPNSMKNKNLRPGPPQNKGLKIKFTVPQGPGQRTIPGGIAQGPNKQPLARPGQPQQAVKGRRQERQVRSPRQYTDALRCLLVLSCYAETGSQGQAARPSDTLWVTIFSSLLYALLVLSYSAATGCYRQEARMIRRFMIILMLPSTRSNARNFCSGNLALHVYRCSGGHVKTMKEIHHCVSIRPALRAGICCRCAVVKAS